LTGTDSCQHYKPALCAELAYERNIMRVYSFILFPPFAITAALAAAAISTQISTEMKGQDERKVSAAISRQLRFYNIKRHRTLAKGDATAKALMAHELETAFKQLNRAAHTALYGAEAWLAAQITGTWTAFESTDPFGTARPERHPKRHRRNQEAPLSDRPTDHEIAIAERLIAGLINNSALAPVVALTGLMVEHFPPGRGLRNSFRFAMAGPDCVKAHLASKHEDLSRQVLRRLTGLRVDLTAAEAKSLAQYLLDPLLGSPELALRGEDRDKPTTKGRAVEFLRNALADGGMRVIELERKARIAGLLKTGQPVSQCRPFRDAKRLLGVKSDRKGFGKHATYYWRLPLHG
jgi:hypothetical protein